MLPLLRLKRFRGFAEASIQLKPITLLLGPNSSGKSSFAHALVGLRDVHASRTGEPTLTPPERQPLTIDLGSYGDLHHDGSDAEGSTDIEISFIFRAGGVELGFGGRDLGKTSRQLGSMPLTRFGLETAGIAQSGGPATAAVPLKMEVVQSAGSAETEVRQGSTVNLLTREGGEVWRTEGNEAVVPLFAGLLLKNVYRQDTRSAVHFESIFQEQLSAFLTGIQYLQANRLKPRRWWDDIAAEDLGADGERTPQVLFRHREEKVLTAEVDPPPSTVPEALASIATPGGWMRQRDDLDLLAALSLWMKNLGLATQIISAKGDQGIHLQAKLGSSQRARDLTDVGFGLSQIIPVLVAGLLAPKDSFLIFDQPESQLHPRPQAVLADFLWMLAKTGRNVFVETHSEALFHRLRLRAAMDPEVASKTAVYFLDAPDVNGRCSQPREVSLVAEEELTWPAGFLMEGIGEEQSLRTILEATHRKKASA